MAVQNVDAFMVKAMCSNVKMEFDLAKANFLEIQEAMETFNKYLRRVEKMEKQHPNNILDGELVNLKDAVHRAKENMNVLRNRLAKNTNRAEEGYRLLMERLQKIEERVENMQSRKRKYEIVHSQYKKLRHSSSENEGFPERAVKRQNKVHQLERSIKDTDSSLDKAKKEKQVLKEACDKMQTFLEDTKGIMGHLKEPKCGKKKAASNLVHWFSGILNKNDRLNFWREHSVDERTIAIEYLNQSTASTNSPRLVLTVTFDRRPRGLYPYSIICIKPNVESLDISNVVDEAIEKNDILEFLEKMEDRWWSHIPLLTEIIQLREEFAIDWLVEQSRLRLMLGNAGRVICTLNVPKTYPHKGQISLEKVDGVITTETVDIKPGDNSITGWLKYLSELYK